MIPKVDIHLGLPNLYYGMVEEPILFEVECCTHFYFVVNISLEFSVSVNAVDDLLIKYVNYTHYDIICPFFYV